MTFEEKLLRLQEIVSLLENEKLSLDKAMEYYKEGVELSIDCRKTLDNAKLNVKLMIGEKEDEK